MPEAGEASQAEALKAEGNLLYKNKEYLKAAAVYTKAIKIDDENATLYSNRAACLIQLLKVKQAIADAETTISLKPDWSKGWYRKGCALEAAERLDEAMQSFAKAAELDPENAEVTSKIRVLTKLVREKQRHAAAQQPKAPAA